MGPEPLTPVEPGQEAIHRMIRRMTIVGTLASSGKLSSEGRAGASPSPGFQPDFARRWWGDPRSDVTAQTQERSVRGTLRQVLKRAKKQRVSAQANRRVR
jgi:hypothetical protein